MKIAVNTRFLLPGVLEGFGIYSHNLLRRIIPDHPEDSFTFYFDRNFDRKYLYAPNVSGRIIFPPARHPWIFPYWYNHGLGKQVNRSDAELFFSPDGFMPLNLNIPSVITIHDVAHKEYPDQIPKAARRYYERYMPKFIQAADAILTVSGFSREEIIRYYEVDPDKIHVTYNGVSSEFKPLDDESVLEQRQKWAGGKPYFLFLGSIHPRKNVDGLIRAYTLYRSKGGADYPLLLAGKRSWQLENVDRAFAESQYKGDIRFLESVPQAELPLLLGGAIALVYCSYYEGFGLPLVEAMACGVPVITSDTGALKEVAGNAGYLVNPHSPGEIAKTMNELIEDEVQRKVKIENGLLQVTKFQWERTAEQTYALMQRLVSGNI